MTSKDNLKKKKKTIFIINYIFKTLNYNYKFNSLYNTYKCYIVTFWNIHSLVLFR